MVQLISYLAMQRLSSKIAIFIYDFHYMASTMLSLRKAKQTQIKILGLPYIFVASGQLRN